MSQQLLIMVSIDDEPFNFIFGSANMIQQAHSPASTAPVYLPQVAAARPRSGMTSLERLVNCLIRTYEAQNRILDRPDQVGRITAELRVSSGGGKESQTTFDWY